MGGACHHQTHSLPARRERRRAEATAPALPKTWSVMRGHDVSSAQPCWQGSPGYESQQDGGSAVPVYGVRLHVSGLSSGCDVAPAERTACVSERSPLDPGPQSGLCCRRTVCARLSPRKDYGVRERVRRWAAGAAAHAGALAKRRQGSRVGNGLYSCESGREGQGRGSVYRRDGRTNLGTWRWRFCPVKMSGRSFAT